MAEDSKGQLTEKVKKSRVFISPAGALIALICFFLPWGKVACQGVEVGTYSASDRELGGVLWLAFVCTLGILGAFIYFFNRGETVRSKLFCIIGALVALIFIIVRYIQLTNDPYYKDFQDYIDITVMYGAYGTVVGFLMVIGGSFFLNPDTEERRSGTQQKPVSPPSPRSHPKRRQWWDPPERAP